MILLRYLSTTLAESLINLSGIPSDPLALFALSDLSILFISSLQAGGKSKPKEHCRTFFYVYNTWMVFVRFNDFFNCSSNLTLGINAIFIISTIFYLYNICIEVIKNCAYFFPVFLKSDAIISYDSSISEKGFHCIPKWFATFFAVTFCKKAFLAFMLLHLFFILIGQEFFPKRSLEVFRFRSYHNLFT